MKFANAVTVVTGAAGGIGSALGERFHDAGATVVGVSRSPQSTTGNDAYHPLAADLSDREATLGVVDTIGRAFLPHLFREFLPPAMASNLGPAVASILIYVLMAGVLFWKPLGLFPARG